MTRHVIVGLGVAGYSAAETIRTLDSSAEILLISDDPHGFYSRPGLAYYLTGELPEKQLFLFSRKDKLNLNVQHLVARVTHLDPASHQIELNGAKRLAYDRLLLATGATAARLNVPGENLRGVVKLDNLEDARQILALVRRNRTAVVVGGGVIGLELAEGMVAQGVKTHYLIRSDHYWSNVLDEIESQMVEHHLARDGVTLHYQTGIAEILGKRGAVYGVRTTSGQVIRCGIVAVGIGVKPRMELAQAAGLKTERGILVNEHLQTSDPDIYAAGDVAQIYDPLSGRSAIDNLWYPARRQGHAAALNMVGQNRPYQREVATNILRLAGMMTTIIGSVGSGRGSDQVYLMRGSSETWHQLPNTISTETGTEVYHLRLMVGEKTLLGALVMGEQKLSLPLREMVDAQVDILNIRGQMMESGAPLGQIVMDYWVKIKNRDQS